MLIVGAGKMTKLLVKHLISKGCTKMTIVNRSMASAEALAAEFPEALFAIRLSPDLMAAVADADVIFTASSSMDPLIYKKDLESMPPAPAVVRPPRTPASGPAAPSHASSPLQPLMPPACGLCRWAACAACST